MPGPLSALTLGFLEGDGRYDPDYLGTEQFDVTSLPEGLDDYSNAELIHYYIIATSNDIAVQRDWWIDVRLGFGELWVLSYNMRRYDVAALPGHGLTEEMQWSDIRHTFGLGFGAFP